jgi:diguanylate cyclase (GGDEF)-like protein/PAS domain S-box-containing protein
MRLRTLIAVAFSIATSLVVLLVGVTLYAVAQDGLRDQVQLRVSHLAASLRDRLQSGVRQRIQDLRTVATLEARTAAQSPGALRPALERLKASHRAYDWLGLVDGAGQVVVGTDDAMRRDFSGRPWIGMTAGDSYMIGPRDASAQRGAAAASPPFGEMVVPMVDPRGPPVGMLVAHVGAAWVRELADEVLEAGGVRDAADLLVVGGDRTVLHGPPGLRGSVLPEGLFGGPADEYREAGWPDGRAFAMATSLPRTGDEVQGGWRVVARMDRDQAFEPTRRMARLLFSIGLGVVVLGSLAGWVFAGRLARPMERWANVADRIGTGELEIDFPAAEGTYELRRLSAALKSMALRLAQKEEALQARIAERTEELLQATRELEAQRQRLAYALEGSRLALWDLDVGSGKVLLSAEWSRMVGAAEGETLTTASELAQRVPVEDHAAVYEAFIAVFRGTSEQYDVEHRFRRDDGKIIWIRSRGHVTERSPQGRALRATGTNSDITSRKTIEQMLTQQAFCDPVTELPNRRLFADRLAQGVARARREGDILGVLFVDLVHFEAVKEAHGHAAGDEVLRQAGARLSACVRASDTVARIGGDEFAVLLDPTASAAAAEGVAAKLIASLEAPFTVAGGAEARIECTIGIAMFPADGDDPARLLQAADAALYAARGEGKEWHRGAIG